MATSKTIRLPFAEKALDATIRDHYTAGTELFIYDRGGAKSIPGLVLWINPQGIEVYQLLKKIGGKKYRRNVGARSTTSVVQAREEAGDLTKSLGKGIDPKAEGRKQQQIEALRGLTFRQALEAFLEQADLAEKTKTKYRQSEHTFADHMDRPLPWFSEDRVRTIHRERSKASRACADHDMRVLRLLWNWAKETYRTEDGEAILGPHPVAVLNRKQAGRKGWNVVPRKQSIIPKAKLPDWFSALYEIRDEPGTQRTRRTGCLLLEALILTGLRFNELAKLPRNQIDRVRGLITIPDTSGKNRRPLLRPITRRVGEILDALPQEGEHLFPGRNLVDPAPMDNTVKLQRELQVRTQLWATPHDLRRVWASAASRAGLPQLVTKRLLNHISNTQQEVTEGYQVIALDELLDYSQQVEDQILRDAGMLVAEAGVDPVEQLLGNLTMAQKRQLFEQLAGEGVQA